VRPDVVFTRVKVAVFVDSCFWHSCPEHGRRPTANEWYWEPKLRRTVERDRQADAALEAAGWGRDPTLGS
jgi:DNA mismatch endonuclease, patch repair protein